MARPRNDIPKFVSIDVQKLAIVAKELGDKWDEWSRKALGDMLLGCVGDDVDPIVRECFENAKGRMISKQEENRRAYENRKSGSRPAKNSTSVSVDVLDAVKRDDQLIWGRFENVFLSQDEFNDLARQMGNVNELHQVIENFSAALSDGTRHSKNHYATLSYWINYRQQKESKENSPQTRCGFEANNIRALENAKSQLRDMVEKGLIK